MYCNPSHVCQGRWHTSWGLWMQLGSVITSAFCQPPCCRLLRDVRKVHSAHREVLWALPQVRTRLGFLRERLVEHVITVLDDSAAAEDRAPPTGRWRAVFDKVPQGIRIVRAAHFVSAAMH